MAVRGNQRVTSANPEGTYEALQKYGMDLVALARQGKLDPTIGRSGEIERVIEILCRRKKNNPPANNNRVARVEGISSNAGGAEPPNSDHRTPSMAPAIGFKP